jgi:hypothetical protein
MTLDQTPVSARVAEAERRAEERLRRQRDLLRPLGWAVIAVVVVSVLTSGPLRGRAAPVSRWGAPPSRTPRRPRPPSATGCRLDDDGGPGPGQAVRYAYEHHLGS